MSITARLAAAAIAALTSLVAVAAPAGPVAAGDSLSPLDSPARIVDTRSDGETVDDRFEGIGQLAGGQVLEVDVAGRAGVPSDAAAVVLNVTAVVPTGPGFISVYPCDSPRPNGSNINHAAGQVIANAVFARLDADGRTCIFTRATTHLVVDVTGTLPGDSFDALDAPARALDTRAGGEALDDDQRFEKTGRVAAGATFKLQIAGRVGVPSDATAAVLNVAVVGPDGPGFVTVYPCDADRPNASNVNYVGGQVVANSVVARLAADGTTCLFTRTGTDLVVDVTGTLPADTFTALDAPARLHDSRAAGQTVDGVAEQTGARRPGTTLELPVAGRAGIPANASAVMLNVTVVGALRPGFVTVHPRNSARPTASNLNHSAGEVIANSVVAKVGGNGEICFFNSAYTDLVIDVTGYFTGPAPVNTGDGCPMEFKPFFETGLSREDGSHLVGEFQMPPGRYETGSDEPDGFGRCDVFKHAFFGDFFAADDGSRGSFVAFQNGRIIVDVVSTDRFVRLSSGDCNPLVPYVPGATPPTDLNDSRGYHVVGDHIQPGTYEILTGACWVERLRSFTGIRSLDRIEFVDSLFDGGVGTRVTIQPTDVGVAMKTECRIRKVS